MKRILSFLLMSLFAAGASVPLFAYAVDTGLNATAGGNYNTGFNTIPQFVALIINSALAMLGVIFLVLMVYAGMLWMMSQGDEKKVGDARGYIFHSILGLIIVAAAYAITAFVIKAITGQQ